MWTAREAVTCLAANCQWTGSSSSFSWVSTTILGRVCLFINTDNNVKNVFVDVMCISEDKDREFEIQMIYFDYAKKPGL